MNIWTGFWILFSQGPDKITFVLGEEAPMGVGAQLFENNNRKAPKTSESCLLMCVGLAGS